tara:strand:- start:18654 stop:19682 length:1029 start_codon:yes stop_codon:yes gene_type:complete
MTTPFKKSSTHYVAVLVRQARSLGLDVDSILSETGISTDLAEAEDKWLDNELLAALVKRIWRETDNETMGFDPQPSRIGTWAIACEFMLSADTLGELLRRGKRILSYLAPCSIGLDLVVDEKVASLRPRAYIGRADPDHFLIEFLTVVWHRFPSWVIDETIQLNGAFFSYSRPAHAGFYEELFQCDVAFDQDGCGFSFNRRYLEKPVTRTHAELEAWLRDSPADLLYLPGRESSVQAHIKGLLRKRLKTAAAFPAFETVCEQLGMSPQVVRRRLAEESTSYQRIKDAIRCDTAKRFLDNPELSVASVAEQTGFSETAAFSRAFKKWTGLTPAQYRTASDNAS